MPRFVVLEHSFPAGHARALHWDLMLETEGVLLTWELLALLQSDQPQRARRLPDHRVAYLDYEGPLSGDRGSVRRRATGMLAWIARGPGLIECTLEGEALRGRLTLELTDPEAHSWRVLLRSG